MAGRDGRPLTQGAGEVCGDGDGVGSADADGVGAGVAVTEGSAEGLGSGDGEAVGDVSPKVCGVGVPLGGAGEMVGAGEPDGVGIADGDAEAVAEDGGRELEADEAPVAAFAGAAAWRLTATGCELRAAFSIA